MQQSHCTSHLFITSVKGQCWVLVCEELLTPGEERQKTPRLFGVILEILPLLSPRWSSPRHQQGTPQSRQGPSDQTHHEESLLHNRNPTGKKRRRLINWQKNPHWCQGQAWKRRCPCQPQWHSRDWHCSTRRGDSTSQTSSSLLSQRHSV